MRTAQSMYIAYHTPYTPRCKNDTSRYENPMRKIHIDSTEAVIVNLTSPAARSPLGKVKLSAQVNAPIR